MNSWLPGEGEGIVKDFGKIMYTLLYLKWITNRHLLYSTLLNVMCQPRWEGCLGENEYIISTTESLHSSPETITTLLISCTLIQNVLALKKNKNKILKRKKKQKQPHHLIVMTTTIMMVVLVAKNLPVDAEDVRDMSLIPVSWRSPGEGFGNPLHYSCLENSLDRGVWWATVQGATRSQTRLSTHNIHWALPARQASPKSSSCSISINHHRNSMWAYDYGSFSSEQIAV